MADQIQDVMGALQQLGINYNPEERVKAQQAQQAAYERYGNLAATPVSNLQTADEGTGAFGRMVSDYLANYNPRDLSGSQAQWANAVGRSRGNEQKLAQAELANRIAEAKFGAENAQQDFKEADTREKNFMQALKTHQDAQSREASAVRAMVNNAEITARTIADKQAGAMTPEQHQALYIQTRAKLLRDALSNGVAMGVVPESVAKSLLETPPTPVAQVGDTTSSPSVQTAKIPETQFDPLFKAAGEKYGVDPEILKRLAFTESKLNPQAINRNDGNGGSFGLMQVNGQHLKGTPVDQILAPEFNIDKGAEIFSKFLQQTGGDVEKATQLYKGVKTPEGAARVAPAVAQVAGTPAPTQPQFTTPNQQKVTLKQAETNATETEKGDYEFYKDNVQAPAQAAQDTLNAISVLRQIPRTQDQFAPYREKVGSTMNALGLDGKLANEASSIQQMRPILQNIANASLRKNKGVQTEGDAQRAYGEFIKITDTQKSVDFMNAWAEELAKRAKAKDAIYRSHNEQNKTWSGANTSWEKSDIAQAAPVAFIGGRAWGYTDWRDKFLKANEGATPQDAVQVWNGIARKGAK